MIPKLATGELEQENVAMVYEYAMKLAAQPSITGLAFGIICTALGTLHQRYPHVKENHWTEMVKEMVRTRRADDNTQHTIMDQVSICRLLRSTTSNLIFSRYNYSDLGESASNTIEPLEDVALSVARLEDKCVFHHSLNGEDLVLFRDKKVKDSTKAWYAFWRSVAGKWLVVQSGLDFAIVGGYSWTISSKAMTSSSTGEVPLPVFAVTVQDPDPLTQWLRNLAPGEVLAAMDISAQHTLEQLEEMLREDDRSADA